MPKLTAGGDFELHPEGSYLFKVLGVEEKEYQGKPRLVWNMRSTEQMEDGTPFVLQYWTGYTCGPKSKMLPLLEACGFDAPDGDEELDTDELLGHVVKGLVAHKQSSQGGTFANIVSVSPRPSEAKPAKKPSKRAPEPPPEEFHDPFADE